MKFDIITIFPQILDSYLSESILGRAQKQKLVEIKTHNLRDFVKDKYKKIDDKPYGGGAGMAFKIEPLIKAIQSITKSYKPKTESLAIIFTPAGKQFDNKTAAQFAKKYDNLILICGRYEGIDARLEKVAKNLKLKIENFSIGPYVLTGGELPAMVLIDSISRQIPGVLGKDESIEEKRLGVGVPVYTRPETFVCGGKKYNVPKVLLSGNHKEIEKWRLSKRVKN
ncbi:MAG: tRNA (guanosine(37)-N1)-methyltransferase TrmD [Spirochaetia bacterium]|nr:MAG: tRNA (guanosine(37)-N1)-methyltransferase TrmD [Spirochaetia bacterium]